MTDAAQRRISPVSTPREPRWPLVLALVLLVTHFFLATRNWQSGFLPGNEFRQTQTALSALFIERTGDYGLAYPTPLFGPPWSVPLEFPLYQWAVAALTTLTGWPLAVSGRTISLACFYLALPAIHLLFRALGVSRARIWLALAAVLATPIHIFYSRAVLIESMALAFSAWFAASFVRAVRDHHLGWAALAMAAGTGASLVKITTLMAWLIGAAGFTGWLLQSTLRGKVPLRHRLRSTLTTVVWSLTCITPAFIASLVWVRFADAVKGDSPGGSWLRSGPLASFTFGTWSDRIDLGTYAGWAKHLEHGVAPWWCLTIIALAGAMIARRERSLALLLLVWSLGVLALFPLLYSYHDYYFFANATLFVGAAAMCIGAWLDHPQRWVAPLLALTLVGSQLSAYTRHYSALQRTISNGGSGLTNFLRDMTPVDSVLIIAGADWQPVIPYHAGRRSVMLRDNLVGDEPYLARVLASLRREDVVAFVANGPQRANAGLRAKLCTELDLEPQVAVSTPEADVYFARRHFYTTLTRLRQYPNYSDLAIRADPGPPPVDTTPPLIHDGQLHGLSPRQAKNFFPGMSPLPNRYRSKIGIGPGQHDGRAVLGAHPDAEIWVDAPATAHLLRVSFGLPTNTYLREGDKTDGVRFEITATLQSGQAVSLLDRLISPATILGDRGEQSLEITLPADTSYLVFRTSPNSTYSFDWAYWGHIQLH